MKSLRILAILPLSLLSCIALGMDAGKKRSHQEAFPVQQNELTSTSNDPFNELYELDFSEELDIHELLAGVDDTVDTTYLTHSSAGDQENAPQHSVSDINISHAAHVISSGHNAEPLECAGAYNAENRRGMYFEEFTPLFASSFDALPLTSRYVTLSQQSEYDQTLVKNTAASSSKLFTEYKPITNKKASKEIKESGRNKRMKECLQKGNYASIATNANPADVLSLIHNKQTYATLFVDLIKRSKGRDYPTDELEKSAVEFKHVYGADSDHVTYAYVALKSFADANYEKLREISPQHRDFTKLSSIHDKARLVLAILAPDEQAHSAEPQTAVNT